MTGDDIHGFIDGHAAAWNLRDARGLCEHHADGGVVISPMFATIEGRTQICESYASLFRAFPDWRLDYGRLIVDGLRVAVAFSVSATHTGEFMGLEGTGRRCNFEGVSLFELEEGPRIREERRFYDFTGLLTRLGVLKVKPGV
jgi:predicted ester cyclase